MKALFPSANYEATIKRWYERTKNVFQIAPFQSFKLMGSYSKVQRSSFVPYS